MTTTSKISKRVYDLHCHSNQSDGALSPEDLVDRAKANDVSVLALTDHDTISGLERARKRAEMCGIELVNGIEFSTQWRGRNIHIVGLNVDIDDSPLKELIESQEIRRSDRAREISERLKKVGIENAYEGAKKHSGPGVVGRPHFAKHLIEAGYVNSMEQAFKRYLGNGKVGDVKQLWPEFNDVIPVIRHGGGLAVLAHPSKYDLTRTKLCALIEDFIEDGGGAIEVVSGKQNLHESADLVRLANKYGLYASMGSDFHDPSAGWTELGICHTLPEHARPVWEAWENKR